MRSIINPGDEILIPSPIYAGYIPLIKTLGGVPVYIDTTKTDFKITPEAIKQNISSKTKAILLNYPTNPTGVILTYDEIHALTEMLKMKRFLSLVMKFMQKIPLIINTLLLLNLNPSVISYCSSMD